MVQTFMLKFRFMIFLSFCLFWKELINNNNNYLFSHFFYFLSLPPFHLQNGRTPLHDAARNGHEKCIELLIRNGSDIHARDKVNDFYF